MATKKKTEGIEIKNRKGEVIYFDPDAKTIKDAVVKAVANKVSLRSADLRYADLRSADLRYADLRSADLRYADLRSADLRYAKGLDANGQPVPLTDADYIEIRDEFRKLRPEIPVVPQLDLQICEMVKAEKLKFDMRDWHGEICDETNWCETTHCRAGAAICLAGKAGFDLEAKYDAPTAGAMIYRASTGRVPDFYASTEDALKDICEWGAKEAAAAAPVS